MSIREYPRLAGSLGEAMDGARNFNNSGTERGGRRGRRGMYLAKEGSRRGRGG